MMRSLLRDRLGPRVEALFDRLEQGVAPAAHRALAQALLASRTCVDAAAATSAAAGLADDLAAWWRAALEGGSTGARAVEVPPGCLSDDPDCLWRASQEEGAPGIVDLLTLLPRPSTNLAQDVGLAEKLGAVAGGQPFREDALAPEAPAASLLLLAAQRAGGLSAASSAKLVRELSEGLPPRRWFVRAGTPRGTANLLRSLIAAGLPEADELLERLLRHVEIRREEALRLRTPGSVGQENLERLRYTLALLEGAAWRRDLRFLNAALKLNDAHLLTLRRTRGQGALRNRLELHYLASVALQERELRELAP
jgi:hypothetical protein